MRIVLKMSEWVAKGSSVRAGIGINAVVVAITLPFFWVPSNASVRAGGWGIVVFALAGFGLCLGFKKSREDALAGRLVIGILGIILALSPLPLSIFLFHLAVFVKGYDLAP